MGDVLYLADGRLAKRAKHISSPEAHDRRENKASSSWSCQEQQHSGQYTRSSYEPHPAHEDQLSSSALDPVRLSQHLLTLPRPPEHAAASAPLTGIAMAGLHAADASYTSTSSPWSNENEPVFDPPWKWKWPASASGTPLPILPILPILPNLPPLSSSSSSHLRIDARRDDDDSLATRFPFPPQSTTYNVRTSAAAEAAVPSAIPTTSQVNSSSIVAPDFSSQSVHLQAESASSISQLPLAHDDITAPTSGSVSDGHQLPQSSSTFSHGTILSPFRDCIGTFGLRKSQYFSRPMDGKVNGYIKFSWPKDKHGKQRTQGRVSSVSGPSRVTEVNGIMEANDELTSQSSTAFLSHSSVPSKSSDDLFEFTVDVSSYFNQPEPPNMMSYPPVRLTQSPILPNPSHQVVSMGAPKMLPSQYGYEAKMDETDRRFWMFYIRNWCPGRCVLEDTNLWLKDFAQMHKSIGVRSAIQSLAGIYIYDYLPLDSIRVRVNQRFSDAEARFTQLLNDPGTTQDEGLANELITIAVILSMQDIVLTERRLKKPQSPRWLQGFRQGEQFLQATDHGSRFWKTSNIQASSLRNSQSIIVGRAVILAQPMAPLPCPHKFDAEREASRFGWLLYGTEKDMYQIHGGCGFSKKLLHVLSQVTYCAARLQQEPESQIVPMTADYLFTELLHMRQWSPESKSWEAARDEPSVIDFVHSLPSSYQIDTNALMTDVTAEAWRLAAILYLQCRVVRNHPDVMSTLDSLAKCITIMPTSGSQFTAQAPLFPVFLLGVLATRPEHKAVSRDWFDEVLRTPVRSSVPPLYTALLHIWSWIDKDIPVSLQPLSEADKPIYLREPWWEQLVILVQQQEQEVLCLT
ncbi:hypothetical protein NOR_01027 [Metarhizium rileyi]|uniref:Transcription factor domain-containing protein n=1 Tax=Metarhizium rileyi (strain RCEF 4871) TaxID=1649241 RepID=A0A167JPR9_METRR|nr:hypothetical protein NOR_01027 [Metarhizium rileyi RCEF 4871]